MAKNNFQATHTQMRLIQSFFIVTIVNSIALGIINAVTPLQLVVGTFTIPPLFALFLTGAMLSLFTIIVHPFLLEVQERRGKELSPAEMMAVYLVVNCVGLWLLTRRSEIFGVGAASWLVVLVVSAILDVLQGISMVAIEKFSKE